MSDKHKHRDDGDESRRRALDAQREADTGGRFNLPAGVTEFRLLRTPGDSERNSPPDFMEIQMHRNVGPKNRICRCGNEPGEGTDPRNCWGCKKMESKKRKGQTKQAAKLFPGKFLIAHVAVKDRDLGEMVGPLLWSPNLGKSAKSLGYKLLNIFSSPKSNKWLDHEKGYNFTIKRTGTGMNDTVYHDPVREDEHSKVPRQILKRLKPFVDNPLVNVYSEEYIKNAYYGTEDKDKGDEDSMKENKKKKKRVEEEESSDEDASSSDVDASDESSDEDSSDEDVKKKKKSNKSKKDKDSSDEDSSDESSDEESSDEDDKDSSDEDSSDESSDEEDKDSSDESSDEDSSDDEPKKKKKKSKKDSSDEEDEDSSDESSDEESSDEEDKDSSDEDSSDESSDEDDKPKKRKPRADKGKKRKTKKKKH